MDTQDPYSPRRLADRAEIQDVIYRYSRSLDRLDYEGLRSCYHPDSIEHHGPFDGTRDEFIEWVRERHAAIPFSSHAVTNILIEFAESDVALVETYIRTLQRYPAEAKAALVQLTGGAAGSAGRGADLFTSSRYVDRFERRDGQWRIAVRTLINDWKQVVEVPADTPVPRPEWHVGRRDAQDPLFVERVKLGIK